MGRRKVSWRCLQCPVASHSHTCSSQALQILTPRRGSVAGQSSLRDGSGDQDHGTGTARLKCQPAQCPSMWQQGRSFLVAALCFLLPPSSSPVRHLTVAVGLMDSVPLLYKCRCPPCLHVSTANAMVSRSLLPPFPYHISIFDNLDRQATRPLPVSKLYIPGRRSWRNSTRGENGGLGQSKPKHGG